MPRRNIVKNARLRLSLTQTQMARALGLSLRTILRYENGGPVPERSLMAINHLLDKQRRGPAK